MSDPSLPAVQRVRNVLRANAFFSWVSGTAVALSSAWLGRQLGDAPTIVVAGVGIGVVVFGVVVLVVSRSDIRILWRGGRFIAAADVVWVVVSAVALVVGELTTSGAVAVAAVAAGVGALAIGEIVTLRQLAPFMHSPERNSAQCASV